MAAATPARQFSSAVNLVEAYVTVTDRTGAPVTGLRASDFEVLDDGQPQAIQAFAAGDFPLSVALAIDHSASMAGNRLRLASVAARSFLGRLRPIRPGDGRSGSRARSTCSRRSRPTATRRRGPSTRCSPGAPPR